MAVTARIGGTEAGGPPNGMEWVIEYDDQTRNITASADGAGRCLVTVQITATISRTITFLQPGQTATTDYVVTVGTGTQTLEQNVPPAQVQRIVGKPGSLGGLQFSSEWSRF